MDYSATIFFFALGAGCVVGGLMLAYPLAAPKERSAEAWRLAGWLGKGLLLPFALWTVMNLGIAWNLQPFMPVIQAAKNAGAGWMPVLLYVLAIGLFLIGSSWCTTTLGWRLGEAWGEMRDDSRVRFKELCATCAMFLSLPAVALVWILGWPVVPLAAGLILGTIAAFAPPIIHAPRRSPMYSRAVARMKFGKYSDAELEIISELEKFEDDFQGWMMLADLYATHFHDLKEAERTVLDVCTRPETTAPQLSIALHRLADWQLKLAGDLEGAKFALGLISERLPNSHLAHMAQLRIAQLPETLDELKQSKGTRVPIKLPALGATRSMTGRRRPFPVRNGPRRRRRRTCVSKG